MGHEEDEDERKNRVPENDAQKHGDNGFFVKDIEPVSGGPVEVSVDDAIERLGMGPFQYLIMVTAGLCFIADAMEVLLLSFLALVLKAQWDLTDDQTASITATVFVGQVLGTLAIGRIGDTVGRKVSFFVTTACICIAGVATAAAKNYGWVLFWRFLVGFGVGGVTIPFDILAEFAPNSHRGIQLSLLGYFWTAGSVLVPITAYFCFGNDIHDNDWRIFVLLCAIPTFLSTLAGLLWVPESPRWLLTKGRHDDALSILRKVATQNGKDASDLFPKGTLLMDETKESDVCELFSPKWLSTTIKLLIAWGGFGFVYYGTVMAVTVVFATAEVSESDTDGSSSFSFDYGAIITSALAEVAGTTLMLLTVDRLGRVPSQAGSYLLGGSMVFLLCLLASNQQESAKNHSAMVWAAFLARLFIMTASSITWISTPEILTTEIRTTGHSVANAMARIGGAVSPYIVNSGQSYTAIGSVVLAVGLVTAVDSWHLPETSQKSLGTAVVVEHKKPSQGEPGQEHEMPYNIL